MKAVLLVGGKGTRLRPLTYRIPKPLIPLMGKPLMMHVIDSLPEEVDETIVPVGYMREVMEDYLRRNPPRRKITIVEEKQPMGTGGAVKNVEDYIDGPFLVINGDSISSLDMRHFVDFHRQKKAFATISLWEVEDPTPFGIVDLDGEQRIRRFQEKPKREEAFSRLINAGVYAMEYETLDHIGDGFVSMEREVFPNILDKGMYGLTFDGYWVDCGTRDSLLNAHWTLMKDGISLSPECLVEGSDMIEPAVVESGASVREATIGPYAYISKDAVVEKGSVVERSVVFKDAKISGGCRIQDAIIDEGMVVESGSIVTEDILTSARKPSDR